MKQFIRRILIAFFVVKILTVSVFLVGATNNEYVSSGSFWNWIADHGKFVQSVTGYFPGSGSCPSSEDTYHHASSYQKEGNVDGDIRYRCVCDYCHQSFTAYASDLQQSYEAQVEELPATGYTSSGNLIYRVSYDVLTRGSFYQTSTGGFDLFSPPSSVIFITDNNGYGFKKTLANNEWVDRVALGGSFVAPITGAYRIVSSPFYSISALISDGSRVSNSSDYSMIAEFKFYSVGDPISFSFSKSPGYKNIIDGILFCYFPVYEIIPDSTIDVTSGDTYNINSRPGVMLGMYGDVNGNAFSNNSLSIVNETNNTYVNPATGTTDTITDWSYDYSTRTYTLTLGGGTTTTVTYGDENVVIKEGDTTYNVYYLVNGSGSEDPGPDVPTDCDHTWTETGRSDPTCTTAGKVTSTCSKCNQTKTETIPATGHSWVVDRTVQTEYDEEGNLLQQGYTLYSCSVCGEQYKDMEGTGPPGPEEEKSIWEKIGDFFGTIGGGFIDIINAIAGKLLDALISLAEMMMEKFKIIVETILSIFDEVPALFGGFLDFLGAIFPYLPPEITTILTFGVIAITFIGILKAVRR